MTPHYVLKIGGALCIAILLGTFVYHVQRHILHTGPVISEMIAKTTDNVSIMDRKMGIQQNTSEDVLTQEFPKGDNLIHLVMVACGNRKPEGMTMIKSAIIWSHTNIRIHIFTEVKLQQSIKDELTSMPEKFRNKFDYVFHELSFPEPRKVWKALFGPCASQRLFLPDVLKDEDAVIYVDTDTLFLRPIDDMWHMFTEFNKSQVAAMAPERLDRTGWYYTKKARHPYYGQVGLNSGVMLMNLTRMREMKWVSCVMKHYNTYKGKLMWYDQDLMNIIFHFNPEKLFVIPCEWNYRSDFCEPHGNLCNVAEHDGISMVHGNRRVFQSNTRPTFRLMYDTFHKVRLDANTQKNILVAIETGLPAIRTECSKDPKIFTKQIERQVHSASHS